MLKYVIESLEDLEDPKLSHLYVEREGKFILEVEGVTPSLDFNNVKEALRKERALRSSWEAKAKAFGEESPETVQGLKDKIAELEASPPGSEDAEAIKKNLKEHYEAKMQVMVSESAKKLEESETRVKERDSKLTNFRLEKELLDLVKDVAKPETLSDALSLVKSGVSLDADTDEFMAGDGITSLKDHVEGFFKSRPYFVRESTSGGAAGGKGAAGGATDWTKMTMTEQAQLQVSNPVMATKLRRKAGLIQ